MTEQEIADVYAELEQMFVQLEADATKGLDYVRDRLLFCRAMQDRVVELQLRVNRALSTVLEQQILTQHEHEVQPDAGTKQRLQGLERQKIAHSMLAKMVRAQAQLLGRTSMDIRLLKELTTEQIKLGEIDPTGAGLTKEETVADLVRATAPGVLPEATDVRAVPTRSSPFVKATTFGAIPLPDVTPVPGVRAVSFTDLLPEDDDGGTSPASHF